MLIGCWRERPRPLPAHPSICPLLAWQKYEYTCKKKVDINPPTKKIMKVLFIINYNTTYGKQLKFKYKQHTIS